MIVNIEVINVAQNVDTTGDGFANFRVNLSSAKVTKKQCIVRFHINNWVLALDKHRIIQATNIGQNLHVLILSHLLDNHFDCQKALLETQRLWQK